jgi:hypothetical protein
MGDKPMYVRIAIPGEVYDQLLARCDIKHPRYRFLKNGITQTNDSSQKTVVVLCQEQYATTFMAWVEQVSPNLTSRIVVESDEIAGGANGDPISFFLMRPQSSRLPAANGR